MTKIRVLHIIKSLGRGGAEMLLPETLKIHDQEKFEFHFIYFLPWKDQMVEEIRKHGGTISCFPANNNIQLILKADGVARYVKDHNIQIIHAHLPWAGIVARLVGKMKGVPVIYTEHNKQERYHIATRIMNLVTMPLLRKVIAVSEDVEQSILKHKPSLKTPVQTILNGVNTQRFIPGFVGGEKIRNEFGIPSHAPVVGTVAVFRFQKRLDVWMELAKVILMKHPDTHFIIVGDGPLKDEMIKKRFQLELTDRVHFAGLQTEVRPYFALFDLYMMCSEFEGLPIALLEAMASGCAVITTDAGGIKEVIRHGHDGLLCGVDDPGKLAEFAVELLTDPERRKKIAIQGRKRVQEAFSIQKMVNELEDVYVNLTKSA